MNGINKKLKKLLNLLQRNSKSVLYIEKNINKKCLRDLKSLPKQKQ